MDQKYLFIAILYVKMSRVNKALEQGSHTQSDSRAAYELKKGLAGRIEISEKNYFQIFS
jgi:hypothetical protein